MTHTPRPRAHLLTGRGGGSAQGPRMTREERAAKKRIADHLGSLEEALARDDLKAARAARTAAWDEVDKLDPYLTRQERHELWKFKLRMRGSR